MLKTTDSLDTVGFFTRFVEDLKAFLDEIIVTGENWPLSHEIISKKSARERGNRPWKIAVAKTHMWGYLENYVKDAFESLINKIAKDRDFDLIEMTLPVEFEESHKIHSIIYDKTLSYYFKEEFKNKNLISPIMYKIISHGKNITLDEYKEALAKQAKLRMRLEGILSNQRIDAIITNATSSHAPKFKEDDIPDNSLIWTLVSSPVISMPAFINPIGLPFGLQLVGNRFHDYLLINLAQDMVLKGYVNEPKTVNITDTILHSC
jgi:Asp-tRNA(Asn)/Glu-tRNA(Gln) amidotransferase A subunit family amidase